MDNAELIDKFDAAVRALDSLPRGIRAVGATVVPLCKPVIGLTPADFARVTRGKDVTVTADSMIWEDDRYPVTWQTKTPSYFARYLNNFEGEA